MVFERVESTRFKTVFYEKDGNNIVADSEFGSGEIIVDVTSLRWQADNSALCEKDKCILVQLFKNDKRYYFEDPTLPENNCVNDFL